MFSIPKPYAVVDPRTMMVHVKHASVTCRTMMTALWLEHVAHEAVTPSLVLIVTKMESPKDWDLSWVGCHRLEETPEHHCE
tara:strand:- start:294 stop:536 length:243 start_codon:yes stop_codon:yes gene_type:complete